MTNKNAPFLLSAEVPVEDLGDGIRRQILGHGDTLMAVRVWFEAEAVGVLHSHPHAQVSYVESGEFEFSVGGEKRIVKAGDCVYAEPGIEHGAVCKSKGVLLDVFSPMREDFLPEEQGA